MTDWGPFLVRRLVRLVIVCFVLVTLVFMAVRLVPGDPERNAIGGFDGTEQQKEEALARARQDLHLDRALPIQYLETLRSAVTFDFGTSFQTQQPVTTVIGDRIGSTLRLALAGTLVIFVVALPLGMIVGALTNGRRRALDVGFSGITGFLGSVPPYVLGVVLVYLFAYTFDWFPRTPAGGWTDEVLPALAVGLGPALLLARVVRVETLGVLGQDYMRTARSKWLSPVRVYLRDVLPNVVAPAITIGGVLFSSLIGGAVVVESIFNRNGLGRSLIEAIQLGDYPLVQAIALILGVTVVVVNTLVDIALAAVDPRTMVRT